MGLLEYINSHSFVSANVSFLGHTVKFIG